jgi:hypothetical protein
MNRNFYHKADITVLFMQQTDMGKFFATTTETSQKSSK